MNKKNWKKVIEVEPDGNSDWAGGAYTLAFVYSNKGNFLVKGYYREVKQYLDKLVSGGYKFIVNYSLWAKDWSGKSQYRDIWKTSNKRVTIFKRDSKARHSTKWEIYQFGNDRMFSDGKTLMKFRRLPKRWIPEFDNII